MVLFMSSLDLKLPLAKNNDLVSPHPSSPLHMSFAGMDDDVSKPFGRVCNLGI